MSSIGLYKDQIEKLKSSGDRIGSKIIRTAIKRFERGEIIIQNQGLKKRPKNVLINIFPIRNRPVGYSDSQIRDILDAHYAKPINVDTELSKLDNQISAMLKESTRTAFLLLDE